MEDNSPLARAMGRMAGIMAYPAKANEFGSQKVTAEAGRVAKELLLRHMTPESGEPRIVPSLDGGLRLEWHEYWVDLSVDVAPGGCVDARVAMPLGDPLTESAQGAGSEELIARGFSLLEELRKNGPPPLPARAPGSAVRVDEAGEPVPRPSRKLNQD